MADEHYQILEFEKPVYELKKKIEDLKHSAKEKNLNVDTEVKALEDKVARLREEIYMNLNPWQIVQIMRHQKRPKTLDYIRMIFTDFMEMHGDRSFGDDKAIIGGTARLNDIPVMLIGIQKGKDTKENILRNFGCGLPEGYRKALRLMKYAEKFHIPVVTFIDTNGAFPGLEGEERGVAEAIARNLLEMSHLKVPIVVTVIGEGGSGGALGIGVGDRVLMLKYATYSVISFEGCASILWSDASKASEAAKILKPTAKDLLELRVIDEIIEEPLEGAHTNPEAVAENLKAAIENNLKELMKTGLEELLEKRYEKFRSMGVYTTAGDPANV
ncbi:MAG: acetyl-CoA carboxylase carboxyltransferase subunit alpha [Candidatus Goldiibacteriota bacterium]|jgi:acetyl-CoA carboxylase carboxyl transferase subunit alpha